MGWLAAADGACVQRLFREAMLPLCDAAGLIEQRVMLRRITARARAG